MDAAEWRELVGPLLEGAGLCASVAVVSPLAGGVSSDIVRLELVDGIVVCAKRALSRLKVAGVWEAPLERNRYEAAWLRLAGSIALGIAPRVFAEDGSRGVFLFEYLPPSEYVLWKAELLSGRFDAKTSDRVATSLSRIHSATWNDAGVRAEFATDDIFDAIRISPYLRTLAERTPDLSDKILAVAEQTAQTRCALVHGDVSPKNVLVSRLDGHPMLLDAECAWFGDPAFDAAFCMNHLLLKAVHVPALRTELLAAAGRFLLIWSSELPAAERRGTELRVMRLLPCLLLARIDGKSPVEYLGERERTIVRLASRPMISEPPTQSSELLSRFAQTLAQQDPS